MKNFSRKILFVALLSACAFVSAKGPKVPYDHPGITANDHSKAEEVNLVSVDDIKESLKDQEPMTVGFDIDDTVLFSSHCFYYGKQKWSPDGYEYLHNQDFWDYVADGCDESSIPKDAARALIQMHIERGDQVMFLTGRTPAKDSDPEVIDQLGKILEKTFSIPNMKPVMYSRATVQEGFEYDKTPFIKEANMQLFYGDSDGDILAAREAGIRGIRIVRAASSTYRPLPLSGGYGEEVVEESWH